MPVQLLASLCLSALQSTATAQSATAPAQSEPRVPRVIVPSAAALPSTELRLEHFVLEFREPIPAVGPPRAPAAGRVPREAGWACLRRRVVADGIQLECDIVFRRADTSVPAPGAEADAAVPEVDEERVLHVEHLSSDVSRLVWREWGTCRARTVTAEWSSDGKILRPVEAGRGGGPRETIEAGEGAVMPLYLVELLREGRVSSGTFRRFDPLARVLEEVEVRTSHRTEEGESVRRVELLRRDGTLAGRFEFRGGELASFQWQDSDLEARRVSAEEYTARSAAPPPRRPE